VTAWLIVCLSVIVAIVAMGMDGGRMMEERRAVQAATDAAALAAANDLYANYQQNQGTDPGGTASAAARASAQANGYANDGRSSVVTVNTPPLSGPFAGKTGYAEIVIQSNLPGTFSAIFTRNPLCVRSRAVTSGRPQNIGVILLQPSGTALSMSGNASVQVVKAPIVVNSNSSLAYSLSGTGTVSAHHHDVAAAILAQSAQIVGPMNNGVQPAPDPLRSLTPPSAAAYPVASTNSLTAAATSGSSAASLQPGVYNGGIAVGGNSSVTLAPGVYILNGGGLQVGGNASLTGDQVLLYNTGGPSAGSINICDNANVRLTPPTSGPHQGICIYQDQGLCNAMNVATNGNIQITGTVYAPSATVQISCNSGQSDNIMGGGFVVSNMQVSGNGQCTINHGNNLPRVPQISFVE